MYYFSDFTDSEEPKKTRFSLDDLNSDKFAPRSRQTENDLKRKKNQELEL